MSPSDSEEVRRLLDHLRKKEYLVHTVRVGDIELTLTDARSMKSEITGVDSKSGADRSAIQKLGERWGHNPPSRDDD